MSMSGYQPDPNRLGRDQLTSALTGRTIAAARVEGQDYGDFDSITLTLDDGTVLEIAPWGAHGEDSWIDVYRKPG